MMWPGTCPGISPSVKSIELQCANTLNVLCFLYFWLVFLFCPSPQVDEKTTGEPGWLYGSIQGRFGWFPCNYVEKILEGEKALSPKKALLPPTVSLSTTSAPAE